MAKLRNIVNNMFLVEKDLTKDALKVFYNVDIHIHNPITELPTAPITNTSNVVDQAPEVVQQQKTEGFRAKVKGLLNEEDVPIQQAPQQPAPPPEEPVNDNPPPPPTGKDFIKKAQGVLNVSKEEVENIQSLEDLIDFIADKKEQSGNQILDEVAIELVFAMAGASNTPLDQIVKKEDKIIIDISYGNKEDDNIGFKVLKRSGVNNVSVVMKKDGNIIDGPFSLKSYNSQLVLFRNSVMGK